MAQVKLAAFGETLIRKRTGEYPHPFHGRFTSREQTALSIRYEQLSWGRPAFVFCAGQAVARISRHACHYCQYALKSHRFNIGCG
jgi:hypothetical protein